MYRAAQRLVAWWCTQFTTKNRAALQVSPAAPSSAAINLPQPACGSITLPRQIERMGIHCCVGVSNAKKRLRTANRCPIAALGVTLEN